VSLCRHRCLTPASLAARRANALKSTGPRTVRGRARVGFNALKLGLHAARSVPLRQRLIRAGYDRQEALYGQIRSRWTRSGSPGLAVWPAAWRRLATSLHQGLAGAKWTRFKESLIGNKAVHEIKHMKTRRLHCMRFRSKPISHLELRYKADQSRSSEADKLCGIRGSGLAGCAETRRRKRPRVGYNEAMDVKGRKRQGLLGEFSESRFRASNFCVAHPGESRIASVSEPHFSQCRPSTSRLRTDECYVFDLPDEANNYGMYAC